MFCSKRVRERRRWRKFSSCFQKKRWVRGRRARRFLLACFGLELLVIACQGGALGLAREALAVGWEHHVAKEEANQVPMKDGGYLERIRTYGFSILWKEGKLSFFETEQSYKKNGEDGCAPRR